MARRYFWKQHYEIDPAEQTISFKKSVKLNIAKLGISQIGGLTGTNPFMSINQTKLYLIGLMPPPVEMKYITTGTFLEPQIVKHLIKEMKLKNPETFSNVYNIFPHDKTFKGKPDLIDSDSNTIIEIKTMGLHKMDNVKKWGIPKYYIEQALLYTMLIKKYNWKHLTTKNVNIYLAIYYVDYTKKDLPAFDSNLLELHKIDIETIRELTVKLKRAKEVYDEITHDMITTKKISTKNLPATWLAYLSEEHG